MRDVANTAEGRRLHDGDHAQWRRWGTYLSDRQWGTVREDYSATGDAWDSTTHDQARSRAWRWGEDAIGGFGDDHLRWCLGVALWNGRDPILKERLFGLTNGQGNHGEDVKEAYYFVDGLPTHAYMRMLYRYPQAAFPYDDLIAENARRTKKQPEYELIDTGVLADKRFFDVVIEYAKASPDDICMRVTATNRGPDPAPLHLLLQLWARNTWTWSGDAARPSLRPSGPLTVEARHPDLSPMTMQADAGELLFCDNETNTQRLFGTPAPGSLKDGPFKDGINNCVVDGQRDAVAGQGTKCAAMRVATLAPGEALTIRLRFRIDASTPAFEVFDAVFASRIAEADEFYGVLQRAMRDADSRLVQRQAFAGMLWCKQFYGLDMPQWLDGDPAEPPPPPGRGLIRNGDWRNVNSADVMSMPDTWEYPWFAAWDLAMHCVTFAMIDPEFAKGQLVLLTREWFMHPNSQLPAYEWNFEDSNPPVHAWAAWRVYTMDRDRTGVADRPFLERVFHKLMMNFTWWVNRKDTTGRNIFQGGFLGLDNIGVFDRSKPLPTGGMLEQSDGTAWMAMYALNLMRIALELSFENHVYEDIATKFFEHFLYIAEAMTQRGGKQGLWDEQDQFFYDVLEVAGQPPMPLRVRSMVGLIPIFAVEVLDAEVFRRLPQFSFRLHWFLGYRPDLANLVSRWGEPAEGERHLLSLLRGHRLKMLLVRALDETEFLSPHGIRSLSKVHEAHPYTFDQDDTMLAVSYEPGESRSGLFGGNSNWRGPVWMPVNYLLIESLRQFHLYYGDDFTVECPVGSGIMMTLDQVADELTTRLTRLFLRGPDGARTALAGDDAPDDHVLFHEYFHGDTGRGLGASHQTGWTGLIALLLPGAMEKPSTAR